jgi:ferric-dicitrate binding protein FerR (iron transport regulator)
MLLLNRSGEDFMQGLRAPLATLLFFGLVASPAWSTPKPTTSLGTIVTAEHARVGDSAAEVGTTIYSGDHLATDQQGSVQIRAGAARLLLQSASAVVVDDSEGAPSAKLLLGTAAFSTGNAKAFTLYASRAAIRAQSDAPTIGQVTYLSEKELVVVSKRGPLTITVDGETQLIEEGTSYRVVLEPPPAMAQGPEGAGAGKRDKGMGGPPLKAGRSYFLIGAVGVTAIVTGFAISEALESPNRP